MKISLNKEMLEKIKGLKGKMILTTAAFTLGAGLTLAGCDNTQAMESTTPATSEVVSEVVSEEVSEIVSEEISEEVSEEISEEVVEEVDYSITAVDATINEITQAYPNEDPRQIAAVVIGTNAKYMTEQEIDEVLNAYGFSKEEVNQLHLDYFAMKEEIINTLHQVSEGATFDNVPDYLALSPIYVYCLNPQEYDECYKLEEGYKMCIENNISPSNNEYANSISQAEGNPSIARLLTISGLISYGFMEFEDYDECIPFAEEYEKTL